MNTINLICVLNPVPISKTLSTKRQFESDNEDDL